MSLRDFVLGKKSIFVVHWNNVFQDSVMPLQDKIANQLRVCEEEDREYQEAIANNDQKEILDALCDRFFTHTYFHWLSEQSDDDNIKQCAIETMEILLDDIATYRIDFDTIIAALDAVINSNCTKFIPYAEMSHRKAEDEAAWIEKNRACQGTVKPCVSQDGKWVFFRDTDGKGKLMKPRCFVAPDLPDLGGE